jgi:hypothetical protein
LTRLHGTRTQGTIFIADIVLQGARTRGGVEIPTAIGKGAFPHANVAQAYPTINQSIMAHGESQIINSIQKSLKTYGSCVVTSYKTGDG